MRDLLTEIMESLRRNKLRTALTGFSVAWGIFMIIVLLGAGNGLMNAFMNQSGDILANTMQVFGGRTSVPYDGLKAGRRIRLQEKDKEVTESALFADNIDDVSVSISQSGMKVTYRKRSMDGYLQGIFPEYATMNKVRIIAGRGLDRLDIEGRKKVAVLAMSHVKNLLDGSLDYDAILGKFIKVGSVMYRVVGVYQSREDSMWEDIYVPFTTLQTIYLKGDELETLTFSFHGLSTEEENTAFEDRYRASLNAVHRADPKDRGSIWIWNRG